MHIPSEKFEATHSAVSNLDSSTSFVRFSKCANATEVLDWQSPMWLMQNFAMASVLSHAVAALGIGACFYRPQTPKLVWIAGAACSIIPDFDVIGFDFGIRYGDFWGHRGFTHSLLFAALLATAIVFLAFPRGAPGLGRFTLWMFLFLATASHGFLDAMTNGGLGVAFFSPFDNHRYFLPWRPIRVSPIGITRFFSYRTLAILQSELIWIWLPSVLLAVAAFLLRRRPYTGRQIQA